MQTAYALHFSEGVPVRKLVTTDVVDNKMTVTTIDCDFSWAIVPGSARTYTRILRKQKFFRPEPEVLFHTRLRRSMFETHNWRFEVYEPFSDSLKL